MMSFATAWIIGAIILSSVGLLIFFLSRSGGPLDPEVIAAKPAASHSLVNFPGAA